MNTINSIITFIFANTVTISIQAAIAALTVMAVNRLFRKRMSPRLSYLLWGLVLIRLVIPVLPESPVSIYNVLSMDLSAGKSNVLQILQPAYSTGPDLRSTDNAPSSGNPGAGTGQSANTEYQPGNSAETDPTNAAVPAERPGTSAAGSTSVGLTTVLAYIWLLGTLSIITYLAAVNISYAKRIKSLEYASIPAGILEELRNKTGLRRSISFLKDRSLNSPCVFGIINCSVLMPEGLTETADGETLYNILLHEFAHIKHNDLTIGWLSYLLCAIHWFNPILWYSCFMVRRCQEICADSYAMQLLEDDQIGGYGRTLLEIAKKQPARRHSIVVASGINENKKALKERIKNIALFSKKRNSITLAGIVLLIAAGITLCTSASYFPGTSGEKLEFQDNILLSVSQSAAGSSPQDIRLEIHNLNKASAYNCKFYIYNGSVKNTKPVQTKEGFKIGSDSTVSFDMSGVDYDKASFTLTYTPGLMLFPKAEDNITLTGKLKAFDKTADLNGWSSVTDSELTSFIKSEGITPAGISKIYNFYTVVLFEKGSTTGYYELWKDTRKNEVMSRLVQGSGSEKPPVTLAGGTASGMHPFANIIINDPALLALGKKLTLEGSGKSMAVQMSGHKGYTVETRGMGRIEKIMIYDKDSQVLFMSSYPDYVGIKSLLPDVDFKADDKGYLSIVNEDGRKIANQTPVNAEVEFTSGMFPAEYVKASESGDIDLKIPLLKYKNSTLYLKSISEANGDDGYLLAALYFIHDTGNKSGNILSSTFVAGFTPRSFSSNANVKPDVYSKDGVLKDMVSLAGSGPGDQFCIYMKKELLEKTGGNFTISLEGLNDISYREN